jgi:putative CocE/NonD family hydrolase
MLKGVQDGPNNFDDFLSIPLNDRRWQMSNFDFVDDGDVLRVPALIINTWGDQTLQGTLALARMQSPDAEQHVILAPGNHCEQLSLKDADQFGELEIRNTSLPYASYFRAWFDHWLKNEGEGLKQLPAYLFYVLGEHQWMSADQWPPRGVRDTRWYLGGDKPANSAKGGGMLLTHARPTEGQDSYKSDPMNPVPTRGGPICCTGNPQDRSGPVDQREVEGRDDVLVYTSEPMAADMRIAGPLSARLRVSSTARDTDLIARLVHVWPDGRATNIQEGALRMRYRDGVSRPVLMDAGRHYDVTVNMRSIAYLVPKGHRIRLTVASSSFPRLARNLQTGGPMQDEADAVVAVNKVHHGGGEAAVSYLSLPVLDQPSVWRPQP